MIEPQNTMMPLPAKSAPVDAPTGEAGFGEMLAQTLGMIPQVDPNAIAKIMGNHQGTSQEGTGEDEALLDMGSNHQEPVNNDNASAGRCVTLPVDGPVLVSDAKTPARPVVDTPVTEMGFEKAAPGPGRTLPRPTPGIPQPPILQSRSPHPITPQVVASQPAPVTPGDGIGQPVLTDQITGVEPPAASDVADSPSVSETPRVDESAAAISPDSGSKSPLEGDLIAVEPTPVDPTPRPEPAPGAPIVPDDPIDVAPGVDPVADPGPMVSEAVRNVAPEQLVRGSADPVEGRTMPTDPVPLSDTPADDMSAPVAMATPRPVPTTPAVDLGVELPVRIQESGVRVATQAAVPVPDAHVAIDRPTASTPTGLPIVDAVQPLAAPVVDGAGPALPTQNTALAQRVLQAVEMQANQPPPRTMVVDIPEIEGLRLVVSVRSGAEVHVVPSTSSTASDGLHSFMDELQGVLSDRGFVMTGDGRRRGSNPHNDERPEPQRAQRPTFRRPQPTDNDLRI